MDRDPGVPLVERRRRRRIVTLRNFGAFLLIALLVLAMVNIRSEMRDTTGGDYGRLYGRGIDSVTGVAPRAAGEAGGEIEDAVSPDPFSLDAARREQYLGATRLSPVPLVDPQPAATAYVPPPSGSNVRIVGGPEGVAVVKEERRPAPPLGGGFGRE